MHHDGSGPVTTSDFSAASSSSPHHDRRRFIHDDDGDARLVDDCQTKAFWRSLPDAFMIGVAARYAHKRGVLAGHPRHGHWPKTVLISLLSIALNKLYYSRVCRRKVLVATTQPLAAPPDAAAAANAFDRDFQELKKIADDIVSRPEYAALKQEAAAAEQLEMSRIRDGGDGDAADQRQPPTYERFRRAHRQKAFLKAFEEEQRRGMKSLAAHVPEKDSEKKDGRVEVDDADASGGSGESHNIAPTKAIYRSFKDGDNAAPPPPRRTKPPPVTMNQYGDEVFTA